MADERRGENRPARVETTEDARAGEPPEDLGFLEPGMAPRRMRGADVHLPLALPGALPENASERPDEFGVPRDNAVVRMPEATAEALENGEPE